MGTPGIAAHVLRCLASAFPGQVVGVLSQPDRPKGRDLQLQPTEVKQVALELGLPIWQPEKARAPESLELLRQLAPDVVVVVAYGQLLPQSLLDIPRHGCLNLHTSLLPRWRGAAPVQWAIAAGDARTGVTLMRMDAGLDTGPIVATRTTDILESDTGATLLDRLAHLGSSLLVDTLPEYLAGRRPSTPQPVDGVTIARKITKDDGRVDWSSGAPAVARRLRAFTPWPGAFTRLPSTPQSRLLKIHAAVPIDRPGTPGRVEAADATGIVVGCGEGALRITELQVEGGRRVTAAQFLAGHPHLLGTTLGGA